MRVVGVSVGWPLVVVSPAAVLLLRRPASESGLGDDPA
jgi:hypothetical protein